MKRKELMDKVKERVSEKYKMPAILKAVPDIMNIYAQVLAEELETSGKVRIPKLGSLKTIEKPSKAGTEAGAGEKAETRKVIRFKKAKPVAMDEMKKVKGKKGKRKKRKGEKAED
jgi:nucleoid DNA-binding protein